MGVKGGARFISQGSNTIPVAIPNRCFSSFSLFLSPLIWRTLPSSTSTFTSSFFSPDRSALNTCASGVSFQSILVLATTAVSLANSDRGTERTPPVKGVEGVASSATEEAAWN
ncbi:hypothetical protein RJ639_005796 [Escallonia herrerae]|uniref:Uncharacterized protein n=1 Tax=Escallonia herrerae TaxID=1293975 RepID=A0AA89AY94_9ASTE|nr:hypothetical protein RJ639_005796 [Escallonia herrerae]